MFGSPFQYSGPKRQRQNHQRLADDAGDEIRDELLARGAEYADENDDPASAEGDDERDAREMRSGYPVALEVADLMVDDGENGESDDDDESLPGFALEREPRRSTRGAVEMHGRLRLPFESVQQHKRHDVLHAYSHARAAAWPRQFSLAAFIESNPGLTD